MSTHAMMQTGTTYTITSAEGVALGVYTADSGRDAITAYCRDAGYGSVAAAAEVDPSVKGLRALTSR